MCLCGGGGGGGILCMREQYLRSPEEGVEFPRGTITDSGDPPGIDARDLA